MDRFDEYIRKHANKDLKVPNELNWDKMNIPIPIKKKKKRKFLFFYILGLGFLLGFMANYLSSSNIDKNNFYEDSTVVNTSIKENSEYLDNQNNTIESVKTNDKSNEGDQTLNRIQLNSLTNSNTTKEKINEPINQFVQNNPILFSKSSTPDSMVFSVTKLLDTRLNQNTNSSKSEELFVSDILNEESNQRDPIQIDEIGSIEYLSKFYLKRDIPIFQNNLESKMPSKEGKFSLVVSSGYTYSRSQYLNGPQAEILSNAESAGHGYTANLGTRVALSNTVFFRSELTFQKLKYFFMHTENLGEEYVESLFRRTTTLRHVCHNNEIETLGVKISLGKDLKIRNKLGSQLNVGLSSNYQLQANGRTLDDNLSILNMENHQFKGRMMHNFHINAGLFLQFDKLRIRGEIGWQKSLNSTLVFDDSDLEYSSQAMNLIFGIERRF